MSYCRRVLYTATIRHLFFVQRRVQRYTGGPRPRSRDRRFFWVVISYCSPYRVQYRSIVLATQFGDKNRKVYKQKRRKRKYMNFLRFEHYVVNIFVNNS